MNPLAADVELQKPPTLEEALALARTYERRLQMDDEPSCSRPARSAPRQSGSYSAPAQAASSPSVTWSAAVPASSKDKNRPLRDSRFVRLSQEEMAQRRLEGLCFNCPEKFPCEHAKSCIKKGIYYLEVQGAEDDEDNSSEEDMHVSMCAVTGIQSSSTLQLWTTILNNNLVSLVDSGSTHCFINTDTAHRLGLVLESHPNLTVGVANGDRVATDGVCKGVKVTLDKEVF
ncbi:hypothetical protein QOZ80_3AG0208590 [Eleusine coracana subsp. coracana]|nr:hypothetical protein QOZ80_3AG0208590 [Eleusine coracana subsp. coracana]